MKPDRGRMKPIKAMASKASRPPLKLGKSGPNRTMDDIRRENRRLPDPTLEYTCAIMCHGLGDWEVNVFGVLGTAMEHRSSFGRTVGEHSTPSRGQLRVCVGRCWLSTGKCTWPHLHMPSTSKHFKFVGFQS